MKILQGIAPNSPEWDDLRLTGLGASEMKHIASGVLERHLALWKVKTGVIPESALQNHFTDYWRDRGLALEPLAREKYEAEVGWPVRPAMVVHDKYDWMRASLDGLGDVLPAIIPVEIKCPGALKHRLALAGRVPPEYFPQCQWIMMVCEVPWMHYWSFDGKNGKLIEIFADKPYQEKLFARAQLFWNHVVNRTEPTLEATLRASVGKRKRA